MNKGFYDPRAKMSSELIRSCCEKLGSTLVKGPLQTTEERLT